jgi:hypothetical protein
VRPALRQPLINPLQINPRQVSSLLWRKNFAAHATYKAVRRYRLTNDPFLLKEGNLDSSFLCRGHGR